MPRVAAAPQPEPEPKLEPEPEPKLEPKPEPKPEPMDIHEMAAEQEIATALEMAERQEEEADEQPDEEEYEDTITLRAIDFYALQDTLEDMRFQIAEIQRDARQDRLETQDMLRATLDRLPPTP
jgi:hypothetical protein